MYTCGGVLTLFASSFEVTESLVIWCTSSCCPFPLSAQFLLVISFALVALFFAV